jgi:hypothetical protein
MMAHAPLETLTRRNVTPLNGLAAHALHNLNQRQIAAIEAGRLHPAVANARYMRLQAAVTRRREGRPLAWLRRYVERAVA